MHRHIKSAQGALQPTFLAPKHTQGRTAAHHDKLLHKSSFTFFSLLFVSVSPPPLTIHVTLMEWILLLSLAFSLPLIQPTIITTQLKHSYLCHDDFSCMCTSISSSIRIPLLFFSQGSLWMDHMLVFMSTHVVLNMSEETARDWRLDGWLGTRWKRRWILEKPVRADQYSCRRTCLRPNMINFPPCVHSMLRQNPLSLKVKQTFWLLVSFML